jgi:uncharacterized protein (DUF2236 family)
MDAREISPPIDADLHAPDSLTLRTASDLRMALMSGRMFVMQVAHPAVGAGVGELSRFREDPWSRLREIERSGQAFLFSGRAASLREGERLRRLHRHIEGIDHRGRPYNSLDPDVYGWVHAVFLDTTFAMHELYGDPLSPSDEERLFREWREGGRILGLRDEDLPRTLASYRAWYAETITTTLEHNDVVEQIVRSPTPPAPPWAARWPAGLWGASWKPLARASRFLTLGALPPAYREKIRDRHPWSDDDERSMRRFRAFVRALVPRLPEAIRHSAPGRRAMAVGASCPHVPGGVQTPSPSAST